MNFKNFIPLPNTSQDYEAYLYLVEFYHDKPKKYYIGSREGLFDGTYEGSPKTYEKEYFQDLGKYDYNKHQMDEGDAETIVWNEITLLHQIKKNSELEKKTYIPIIDKWISWNELYNVAINGGKKLKNYNPAVEEIQDGIENGTFRTERVEKEVVYKWPDYQPRFQKIIHQHKRDITIWLKDTDGKWLDEINPLTNKPNHRGVVTLEDFYGKGKHRRIGSKHTVEASMNIKQVEHLTVIYVPKSLWKKLSRTDIKEIAQWDNPQDNSAPKIPTPEDEHAGFVAESCIEKNIEPEHPSFWPKLERQKVTRRQFPHIIKKARKLIKDKKAFDLSGEKQIDWDDGAATKTKPARPGSRAEELENILKSFNGVAWSGAVGDAAKIINKFVVLLRDNPEETRFKFWPKIPAVLGAKDKKEEWDAGEYGKPYVKTLFKMFENEFRTDKKGNPRIKIEIEDLKFTEPDLNFVKND